MTNTLGKIAEDTEAALAIIKGDLDKYASANKTFFDKLKELQEKAKKEREKAINDFKNDTNLSKEDRDKALKELKTQSEEEIETLKKDVEDTRVILLDKRKFYEDFFDKSIELNKKNLAEELLLNKNAEGAEKQNDADIIKRYDETHNALTKSKAAYIAASKKQAEEFLKNLKESHKDQKKELKEHKKELQEHNKEVQEEEEAGIKKNKDKWAKINKDLKEYTDVAMGALNNMFGSVTKYLDQEKAVLTNQLGEINKKIAAATKELEAVKKRSTELLADSKDKYVKDNNLGGDQEKLKQLEELEKLHNQQAEMEAMNDKRKKDVDYQSQQLTDNELDRLYQLKLAHGDYAQSLQGKTDADKQAQKDLDALGKEKEKKEKDIKRNDQKKRRAEMSQQMIQAAVNIALGITKALSLGPPASIALAAIVGAAGAVQLGIMAAQMKKIDKLEDGGLLRGKRHSTGGMRIQGSSIEVEGGEYVVNRESTDKNLGLIRYINSQRRELAPTDINSFFGKTAQGFEPAFSRAFANGGLLPNMEPNINVDNSLILGAIESINFEPKVSVTDINTVQSDMVKVDAWTGM